MHRLQGRNVSTVEGGVPSPGRRAILLAGAAAALTPGAAFAAAAARAARMKTSDRR